MKPKGFTIVELLIVIVVIGILAAITMVAFTGVTNSTKTSSAKSTSQSVARKAGLYLSETGTYPLTSGALTGATPADSYFLSGVNFVATIASAPSAQNTIIFRKCGTTPNTTQANITASNVTGLQFVYWDYTNGNANSSATLGNTNGAGVACPTS